MSAPPLISGLGSGRKIGNATANFKGGLAKTDAMRLQECVIVGFAPAGKLRIVLM
jgi:hypothetical protein